MTETDRNELDQLIGLYLDGVATSGETDRLSALIAGNAHAARIMARACRLDNAMMEHFGEQEAEMSEWLRAQMPHSVRGIPSAKRETRRFFHWISLAVAATLAIVAGGVWRSSQGASLGLRVAEVRGQVSGFRGEGVRVQGAGIRGQAVATESPSHPVTESKATSHKPLRVGDILRPGDGVEVGADGYAKLAYPDGTQIDLHGSTRLRVVLGVGENKDAKRLALDGGLLVCSAVHQKKPFLLETAHGVAEVVGTRFSLGANAVQTTLAVEEGRVDLHQNDQRLEVSAGETAVADAGGMRNLAPADAWITELLARAEAGPWDVVNLGTGVYSNDVWRMDARGGPAERRIWNMLANDRNMMVIFRDGKRWARGVVVGRMMILPESQAALEVVGSASATNMAWRTYNYRVTGAPAAYQKVQKASVSLSFGPPGEEASFNCGILHTAECAAGVWYRFAAYFDTETPDGLRSVKAVWPDENVATPQAAAWASSGDRRYVNKQFELGLEAKGVRMVTQGLKFVPLGPDMPLPPKELMERK